ncbi:MAG TPA: helix-turn-helix domain-containing protein, partial [Deltaproteobacteria bacterium]|nr:helix-turn-helix domain-containing protein [Deltaproteobacteria bacterium]
ALSLLMAHDWPGNIRELENVIERAFILCDKGFINVAHLPEDLTMRYTKQEKQPGIRSARELMEAQAIRRALERNANNRLAAARELGILKSTLFRKMKKLCMDKGIESVFPSRRTMK